MESDTGSGAGVSATSVGASSIPLPTDGVPGPRRPLPARAALQQFLDAVPHSTLSLLVAPAGTGKTTAVAVWTAAAPASVEVRWLAVDAVTRSSLTQLPAGGPLVLVVDDAHTLSRHGVEEVVRFCTEPPGRARLLLLSRREARYIPLALTLDDRVQATGYDALRLEDQDAAAVVRAHHADASAAEVATVMERCQGWAAALVLAAHELRSGLRRDPPTSIRAESPLLSYLVTEVLPDLQPELRRVLVSVATSPAPLTAEEVTVLSDEPQAVDLLELAASEGLLVRRHPVDPPGWTFHPLLVELVRRATIPSGPEWPAYAAAHERASHHYRRRRDGARALHHAELTGDLELQLSVLREFAIELLARGQVETVHEALSSIPGDVRENLRQVQAVEALVLRSTGSYEAARVAADHALSVHWPDDLVAPTRSGGMSSWRNVETDLAILDVWEARCGWRPTEPALARATRALRCHHGRGPTEAHDLAGVAPLRSAWLMLELALLQIWTSDLSAAAVHIQAVDVITQQEDLPRLRCSMLSLRATLEMMRGAHQSAAATADACLALGAESGVATGTTLGRVHLVRGWARLHAYDLHGAGEDLERSRATDREGWDPLHRTFSHLLESNLLIATGQLDAARQTLDAEAELPDPLPRAVAPHAGLARLLAAALMGDVAALEGISRDLRRGGLPADAHLAHAVALGLGGHERQAVPLLDMVLSSPPAARDATTGTSPAPVTAATVAVSRLALLQRIGTPDAVSRAASLLSDVLARIAPQRLFWVLGTGALLSQTLVDLLDEEASRPDGHPIAGEAAEVLRRHPRPYPDQTPPGHPAEPLGSSGDQAREGTGVDLTARELDVLRALSLGGSNAEIAEALFVSDNTVKTHLASIYRKLEVESRREALDVARNHDLI